MWFFIGAIVGITLMYAYGLGYDYICLDLLEEYQAPVILTGPLA
jgi:hypothetical protein